MDWMKIAWSQVGVSETPGAAATPEIIEYFRGAGRPDISSDEVAWCMAFVVYCLARSGTAQAAIEAIPKSERLLAYSALRLGEHIETLRVGAVAVVRTSAGYHTGFVHGWTDTHLKILGGNQKDSVSEAMFARSSIVGLVWPGAVVTPAQLAKGGSRIAGAAQENKADAAKAGSGVVIPDLIPSPPEGGLQWLQQLGGQFEILQGLIGTFEQFLLFVMSKGKVIGVLIALYYLGRLAWRSGWIGTWRAEDASTGKTAQEEAA